MLWATKLFWELGVDAEEGDHYWGGPAGLTAGLELLRRTGIKPVILEASSEIGGISRTIRYKGNRMDIGGHRFFSKSDRVMQWWMDLMPPDVCRRDWRGGDLVPGQAADGGNAGSFEESRCCAELGRGRVVEIDTETEETDADGTLHAGEHGHTETVVAVPAAVADPDLVMLIRPRKSRIYYLRKFFDYPIKLTGSTLKNLGAVRTVKVGVSYFASRVKQIAPEKVAGGFSDQPVWAGALSDVLQELYGEGVGDALRSDLGGVGGAANQGSEPDDGGEAFCEDGVEQGPKSSDAGDVAQKGTDTSLIERFMYPKFGPGQLWEHAAETIVQMGGEICMGWKVSRILTSGKTVTGVEAVGPGGQTQTFEGDYFFSTMPMRELVQAMDCPVPANVKEVSDGLQYRDFITVGLLCDRLKVKETGWRTAEGYVDLCAGAGCNPGAVTDLQ